MKVLAVLYKFGTVEEIGKNLGSFDYILTQLKELQKNGIEITVLAPWVRWFRKGSTNVDGIQVVRYWPKMATKSWRNLLLFKLMNQVYIWRTGELVKSYSKKLGVDVIYVRQARETGYAVAKVKDRLKVPVVFQPITTWKWHFEESQDSWWKSIAKDKKNQKRYARLIMSNYDYFITYTSAMIDEYVSLGASRDKFTVIPPAVRHDFFKPLGNKVELREELGLPQDKKLIINVSRINLEEKGQLYLLEAFRKVLSHMNDVMLVIIGPGTNEQVRKLNKKIDELELENSVSYLGSKEYSSLPKYMSACDIGTLPSIWFEAFGRTILDMMSCGLPMVTTTSGGMAEANLDQETGFTVEPKSSEAISKAIIDILSDKELQKTMGENARQRVLNFYTFEKITNKFIEIFEKVTKR